MPDAQIGTSAHPGKISLRQCLDGLRSEWSWFAQPFLNGEFAAWIGSAVSMERLPNLKSLLQKLLASLHQEIDPKNDACPYKAALKDILGLVSWPLEEVDWTAPPDRWKRFDQLLSSLVSKYSVVLGILIEGEEENSILWKHLQILETYGDPGMQPDADHLFLALLVEEGFLQEIVTTNWDALIESANESFRDELTLSVVASSEDLQLIRSPLLLKIHGCARLGRLKPEQYRRWIVATGYQISNWNSDPEWLPHREKLQSLIRERRALFVGLSGQDHNVLESIMRAVIPHKRGQEERGWVVFAKEKLEQPQAMILKALYGSQGAQERRQINQTALVPLYSKPLLGSLYVFCLFEKARFFLEGADDLQSELKQLAKQKLDDFEERICAHFDAVEDANRRWRLMALRLSKAVGRLVRLFREQTVEGRIGYRALHPGNLQDLERDNTLSGQGYDRLILLLAAIQGAADRGKWLLKFFLNWRDERGQLVVQTGDRKLKIFVFQRAELGYAKLLAAGWADDLESNSDTVVIYAMGWPQPPRRNEPEHDYRSQRPGGPLEVYLEKLLDDCRKNPQDLIDALRLTLQAA